MVRFKKEPHGDKGNFRIRDEQRGTYLSDSSGRQIRRREPDVDDIVHKANKKFEDDPRPYNQVAQEQEEA